MDSLATFDEIFVISDIHMGGKPGFQMLREVDRLGHFIRYVAEIRPEGRVALIFNGDVIDSLAEDIDGYVARSEAVTMIRRIFANFAPVWDALEHFISQPKRHLVFVTGNHDIEMALPTVQYCVRQRIAKDDPAANGALTFATSGAGYACGVGNARIYCTHGNEVDQWNIVDYDQLGQLGNAINAGRDIEPDDWSPNAGTRMVVDVMNKIKQKFPFVDLLKPENKAVVPILFVLDPKLAKTIKLDSVLKIGWGNVKGRFASENLLGGDDDLDSVADPEATAQAALDELLGAELRDFVQDGHPTNASDPDQLLLDAEEVVRGERQSASSEGSDETLGWWGMAMDRIRGVDKAEALRRALIDWLEGDETFNQSNRDDTFEKVCSRTSQEIDFIVTGHTHLRRAIQVEPHIDRFYYNCGTWARLMQFRSELLADKEKFTEVFEVLKTRSMEALDQAVIGGKSLVLDDTSAVRIRTDGDGTVGQLLQVKDTADGKIKLSVVKDSEYRIR